MSKRTTSFLVFFLVALDWFGLSAVQVEALQITGNHQLIKAFPSKILGNQRDLIVLLPRSYSQPNAAQRRYPVLYMQDGNNLYDPQLAFGGVDWGVDEAVDELTGTGELPEVIVVGIFNTAGRMEEYTPVSDPGHGGGKGDAYRRFMVEELKPFIDKQFRTKTDRASTSIGGSSLGALISLYVGLSNPETFGGIIVMSPSFWWANGWVNEWVSKQKIRKDLRMWVDMGTNEGEGMLESVKVFDRAFDKAFPEVKNYRFYEIPGAGHNESAWRSRIRYPLLFVIGQKEIGDRR